MKNTWIRLTCMFVTGYTTYWPGDKFLCIDQTGDVLTLLLNPITEATANVHVKYVEKA